MKLKAAIDIGSNTVLVTAGELGTEYRQKYSNCFITGLGQELVQTGKFGQIAMDQTYQALQTILNDLHRMGMTTDSIVAVTTEASRSSMNAGLFFEKIFTELGLKVKVITPMQEAFLMAFGASIGLSEFTYPTLVIDIGGASTELAFLNTPLEKSNLFDSLSFQNNSNNFISLPVGALRANAWKDLDLWPMKLEEQSTLLNGRKADQIVSVDGTLIALGMIDREIKNYDESLIHGIQISLASVQNIYDMIKGLTPIDLQKRYAFLGKRVHTLVCGTEIALWIGKKCQATRFMISTSGLRHGILHLFP